MPENKEEDSEDEESELEKEIEEIESQEENEVLEKTLEEEIKDNEFHEFLQPSTEISAPILERVETPQQESLEQDVASTPVSSNVDEGQIDYSVNSNYSEGGAINYQTNTGPPILSPTEISGNLPRQELLNPLTQMETPQDNINPKMIDTEFIEEKRRLPFEKEDKKYKEFKL